MNQKVRNITLLLVLVCFAFLFKSNAQAPIIVTPYPVSAKSLNVGYGTGDLTIRIAFPSSCLNDTVVIRMPETVEYVSGSLVQVTSTPASMSISESDISDLRQPKFVIADITTNGDITFKVSRKVNCTNITIGKDTVEVFGSCGSFIENSSNYNVYNILTPSLSFSQVKNLNNVLRNTVRTREVQINNGGNGDIDTVLFYIVYPSGNEIENNRSSDSILANGVYVTPFKTSGDTAFYKFFGTAILGTSGAFSNGDSILIEEDVKINECSGLTHYFAGWGTSTSDLCQSTETDANFTMANGVPTLSSVSRNEINYVDRCTPYDIEFGARNGGTGNDTAGAMFGVTIKHGYVYPNRTYVQAFNSNVLTYTDGKIGGLSVSTFVVTGNIVYMDLNDLYPITGPDPDGIGVGLDDLDGDGYYDDLPRGETLKYTLTRQWKCNTTCGYNKVYYCGAQIYYTDMCGNSTSTIPKYSYRPVYESSFTGTTYVPANVTASVPFRMQLKEGHYINSFSNDNANTRYTWKIVLPAGFSVSGGGSPTYGGVAASYSQVGDSVYISSSSNALRPAGIDLMYSCGVSGVKTINYTLVKINDSVTNCSCQGKLICSSVSMSVFCPASCDVGPTNYVPTVSRTDSCLGWTDNTLSTRQSRSAISSYDLSKALYLDTIQIVGSGLQNDSTLNLFLELNLNKGGTTKKLDPVEISLKLYRASLLVATGTTSTYADNSTSTLQVVNWDMTSLLPSGGLLPGDSFVSISKYVVATNSALPENDVQSGGKFFHYNEVSGVRNYCFEMIPEMYLTGTHLVDGRNGFYASACNISAFGGSGSNLARRFNTSGTKYTNEYRPVFYIDSIVMVEPENYEFVSMYNTFNSTYETPSSINGKEYSFVNPGTWKTGELTKTNVYAGRFIYRFQPTCKTKAIETHRIKVFIKDYYYANKGKSSYPSQYEYILNNSHADLAGRTTFRDQGVIYSAENKPKLVLENTTGDVKYSRPQEFWDFKVSNNGLANASKLWFAVEKPSGSAISIDSVVLLDSNKLLSPITYNLSNSWFKVSDLGVVSGNNLTIRVYFKSTNCNADSIYVKTGWNCGGYPATDPIQDTNVCVVAEMFARVIPNQSKVQLTIIQQPGNGSPVPLCTLDSVLVAVNSSADANIVDPVLLIRTPVTGVALVNTVKVEYPRNSGNYETLNTTAITNGLEVDLTQHSNIASSGILGVALNQGFEGRQAKVVVDYITICSHSSGNPLEFEIRAKKPCGDVALGSGTIIKTEGIRIDGASTLGLLSVEMDMPSDSFNCKVVQTMSVSATPAIENTQLGDTLEFTVPQGMEYLGNLTNVANCTNCGVDVVPGPNNTTLIKVGLDSGINYGTTIKFSFDLGIENTGDCGPGEITLLAKRQIAPLPCFGAYCPNSNAIIGAGDMPVDIYRPKLSIPLMTAGFLPFDPDYTYNFQVLVENDSTGSYVPSDDTVKMEFYFDENKDGIYNVGIDRKVGENDITLNFSPGQSHSINGNIQDTAYPDPSRALFAVIDPGTSPNCNCSKEVQISPFIVGLPVELNSFDVVLNNRIANLIWTTASETNNEGWIIQRRINENTGFENIGEVAGAGHSNQNLTYFFDDDLTHVQGRIVYYRLMQQDFDGQVKYSKTKAVYLNNISKKALVYPNPSNGMVAIKIPGNIDPIQYSLVNSVGQVVLEGSANNNEQINVSSLAKGIYFVNIFNTDLDIERISLLIE